MHMASPVEGDAVCLGCACSSAMGCFHFNKLPRRIMPCPGEQRYSRTAGCAGIRGGDQIIGIERRSAGDSFLQFERAAAGAGIAAASFLAAAAAAGRLPLVSPQLLRHTGSYRDAGAAGDVRSHPVASSWRLGSHQPAPAAGPLHRAPPQVLRQVRAYARITPRETPASEPFPPAISSTRSAACVLSPLPCCFKPRSCIGG